MSQLRPLHLYNTLTHQKEEFIPLLSEGKAEFVGIYSCGPTVYSTPHIWNYKAACVADLLRNALTHICGYPVKSVMNITDVGHLTSDGDTGEDKLEKWAQREGITAREVAKKYEAEFLEGMQELNIERFDVMPRATEHIAQQIRFVQILAEKGYTYIIPTDGVYMDTSKIDDYGKLMGPNYKKRLANLNAGERVEDAGKKNPTDFALWKFNLTGKKRDMERESPWGIGFPGRHIECSAMSSEYLGEQFDIHHGGVEHVTVHHSDEIAQSECAFGKKPWVKYWIHNALLQVDGGKMGKSLGNAYTLKDIANKGFSPLDLRYFFLMAQYSSSQNFSRETLAQAKSARANLSKKLQKAVSALSWSFADQHLVDTLQQLANKLPSAQTFIDAIDEAIKDNLNTPKLLSVIGNASYHSSAEQLEVLYRLEKKMLKVGLFEEQEIPPTPLSERGQCPPEITDLANQRLTAKAEKNYALADELRNQIQDQGYAIKDIPGGFEIEKISRKYRLT